MTWEEHDLIKDEWSKETAALRDLMYSTSASAADKRDALKEFKPRMEAAVKRLAKEADLCPADGALCSISVILHKSYAHLPRINAPKEWQSRLYEAASDLQ
jgi:hypothetical protein